MSREVRKVRKVDTVMERPDDIQPKTTAGLKMLEGPKDGYRINIRYYKQKTWERP